MNPNVFKKIIEEVLAKRVWDKLTNLYEGDEKLKRVKLQTLSKKLEMIQMKVDESNSKFFSHLLWLIAR